MSFTVSRRMKTTCHFITMVILFYFLVTLLNCGCGTPNIPKFDPVYSPRVEVSIQSNYNATLNIIKKSTGDIGATAVSLHKDKIGRLILMTAKHVSAVIREQPDDICLGVQTHADIGRVNDSIYPKPINKWCVLVEEVIVDPDHDIAIIRTVKPFNKPFVHTFISTTPPIGSQVTVIGNAHGIQKSVLVTNVSNDVPTRGVYLLAGDIDRGMSGAGVFNKEGRLVGIISGNLRAMRGLILLPLTTIVVDSYYLKRLHNEYKSKNL